MAVSTQKPSGRPFNVGIQNKTRKPVARPSKKQYIVHMNEVRFDWNEAKNRLNRRKHGVSFEEAQTVFCDESALRFHDPDHSTDEDRFLMLGISSRLRTLIVCHCYRASDTVIRMISARKADKHEEADYWNER